MIGLVFRHAFAGGIELADKGRSEAPIALDLSFELPSFVEAFRRPLVFVEGTCTVDGVFPATNVRGTMALRRAHQAQGTTATLAHALRFDRNDAGVVRLEGRQVFGPGHLYATLSVIHVTLHDAGGTELGRGRLRPDVRSGLGEAVRSFRFMRER